MDIESIKKHQQTIRETGNMILHDLTEIKLIVYQGLTVSPTTLEHLLKDVEIHKNKLTAIAQELIDVCQSIPTSNQTFTMSILEQNTNHCSPTE